MQRLSAGDCIMEPASPDTLLTAQDVLAMTGYKSRTSLYRLMQKGRCPHPVVIGGNRIRWRSGDIEDWLQSLPTRHY
jgi:prophage regulatory protein